jgi:diamine N-acetyltransferase
VVDTGVYLVGRVVTLRDLVRADVDEMARWPRFSEPELAWANLDLSTPEDRDLWFARSASGPTRRRFAILDPARQVIGTISLRNIDPQRGEATLGIILSAGAVNRGYGTDAIRTLLAYAFGPLGLRQVCLEVAADNHRARRCYAKCGFQTVGQYWGVDGVLYLEMVVTPADLATEEADRA